MASLRRMLIIDRKRFCRSGNKMLKKGRKDDEMLLLLGDTGSSAGLGSPPRAGRSNELASEVVLVRMSRRKSDS